jgi:hypothetical protein
MAGIADARKSRIGDDGDMFARSELLDELGSAAGFIVLVIADERLADLVMAQEVSGVPGILAGDDVRALQRLERAQGDVPEIPNGRSDERKHGKEIPGALPALGVLAHELDGHVFRGEWNGLAFVLIDVL